MLCVPVYKQHARDQIVCYQQGIPFAIKIIKVAELDYFHYHRHWNGLCYSQSILTSAIQFYVNSSQSR